LKDQEVWLRRIMARDSCSREIALAIINNQMPVEIKVKLADIALDNSGSPKELESNFVVAFTTPGLGLSTSELGKEPSSKKKKEQTT